ncbi:N-6 DNA methylase, partial [Staphylococcus aureus]|uniref:N-6 DNA methylase n=1 Tax=Staphylococcus aureus TaxID=1280 RepID=UPI0037D9EA42
MLPHPYEFLIPPFPPTPRKKPAHFYTPQQLSNILPNILTHGKHKLPHLYHPTSGSRSFFLRVRKQTQLYPYFAQQRN